MNSKKRLKYYLENDLLTDQQTDLIINMLQFASNPNKGKLMEILPIDRTKIDSAIPLQFTREAQKNYPSLINGTNLVMSYEENSLGQIINLNNELTKHIIDTLKPY